MAGADGRERLLLARAREWEPGVTLAELTAERLARVTGEQGVDFSTALLYQRLVQSPEHGRDIERINAMPEDAGRGLDARVVIVPGAFYRKFPQSGADGRLVRAVAAQLGWESDLIPLDEFGSMPANAATILEWLAGQSRGEIILVSLSKGASEIKLALNAAGAEAAFQKVSAWVNLSGLLRGTPMVSWVYARRLRQWRYRIILGMQGFTFDHLRELMPGPEGLLDFDPRLPPHVRAIHVAGFPLARHMSNTLGRRCHRRLQSLGPNDGALLLADVCRASGLVYPIWGADHYLRPPGADAGTIAAKIFGFLASERKADFSTT